MPEHLPYDDDAIVNVETHHEHSDVNVRALITFFVVWVVFAVTAVSPPLLLGRRVGVRQALLTSARAVGENPLPMTLWALVILVLTSASIVTGMLGFLVTVPVLGHASWHAYRDLVDAEGAALRHP